MSHHGFCYAWMKDAGLGCPYMAFIQAKQHMVQSNFLFLTLVLLSLLSVAWLSKITVQFFSAVLKPYLQKMRNPLLRHARQGSWAIVTGASDGIGREFALQLAKKYQLNTLLISRNEAKLSAVAKTITNKTSGLEARVYPMDMGNADESAWEELGNLVKSLDVGVLVNCAGVSNEMPTPFHLNSREEVDNIIKVNVLGLTRLTRLVLPQMLLKKRGCVMNVGSACAILPMPYLSVYGATKAFVRSFSFNLFEEVRSSGVAVHNLNTFAVATAMSKIRHASYSVASPENYVSYALRSVGNASRWDVDATPFPSHSIFNCLLYAIPQAILAPAILSGMKNMRSKALRRSETKEGATAKVNSTESDIPATPRRRTKRVAASKEN